MVNASRSWRRAKKKQNKKNQRANERRAKRLISLALFFPLVPNWREPLSLARSLFLLVPITTEILSPPRFISRSFSFFHSPLTTESLSPSRFISRSLSFFHSSPTTESLSSPSFYLSLALFFFHSRAIAPPPPPSFYLSLALFFFTLSQLPRALVPLVLSLALSVIFFVSSLITESLSLPRFISRSLCYF